MTRARTLEQLWGAGDPGLLVTGAGGFVGRRLLDRLSAAGIPVRAVYRILPEAPPAGVEALCCDVNDRAGLAELLARQPPARVLHLAAVASPRAARERPREAWQTNVGGTLNLLRAAAPSGARVLVVSTAQVYGRRAGVMRETDPPRPETVYAATKLEAERLALLAAERGRHALVARPFNHSGPGQSTEYVLPAFARSLREARDRGEVVRVGNLEPERDFMHVDDVLDAYALLLERASPGSISNVCSGRGTSIGELLEGLAARFGLGGADLERLVRVDPGRVRSDDPAQILGDTRRLQGLGFEAARGLAQLLDDVARDAGAAAGG